MITIIEENRLTNIGTCISLYIPADRERGKGKETGTDTGLPALYWVQTNVRRHDVEFIVMYLKMYVSLCSTDLVLYLKMYVSLCSTELVM